MARVSAGPATPKRRRMTKKERKALRTPREPNQWQKNLTNWNANNSGWCIPKKGTADYDKVKNFHIRRRPNLRDEDMMSPEREYRSPPNLKSTDKRTPYRRVAEMQTPRSIDFDRYLEEYE